MDLSLILASLDETPERRIGENDGAPTFFESLHVTPGWEEPEDS